MFFRMKKGKTKYFDIRIKIKMKSVRLKRKGL